MKRVHKGLGALGPIIVCLGLALGCETSPPLPEEPTVGQREPYVIGVTDQIQITFWKNPELSGRAVVRSDGMVSVPLLDKLRIDDVVGAIPVHLVAGIWGTLAVGIFGAGDLMAQIIGIAAVGAFVSLASALVWFALKLTVGVRVSEEVEDLGLDKAELGMEAYPEFGFGSQRL